MCRGLNRRRTKIEDGNVTNEFIQMRRSITFTQTHTQNAACACIEFRQFYFIRGHFPCLSKSNIQHFSRRFAFSHKNEMNSSRANGPSVLAHTWWAFAYVFVCVVRRAMSDDETIVGEMVEILAAHNKHIVNILLNYYYHVRWNWQKRQYAEKKKEEKDGDHIQLPLLLQNETKEWTHQWSHARYRKSFYSRQFVIFDKSLKIVRSFVFFSILAFCRTGCAIQWHRLPAEPCANPKRIENSIASIDVIIIQYALMFETGI